MAARVRGLRERPVRIAGQYRGMAKTVRGHAGLPAPPIHRAGLPLRRGRGVEAAPLYSRALRIAASRLGPDHHLTACATATLARLALAAKD